MRSGYVVLALLLLGSWRAAADSTTVSLENRPSSTSKPDNQVRVKRALVIGVDRPEDPKDPQAHMCTRDARDFADFLRKRMGFPDTSISLLTSDAANVPDQPTGIQLNRVLKSFVANTQPDSEVVFFFSGHEVRNDDGEWLTSMNADLNHVAATCASYSDLVRGLKTKKPHSCLLVLDRMGAWLGSNPNASRPESVDLRKSFSASSPTHTSQFAEFRSTRPTEIAREGMPQDFHDSVFTHYLIMGLDGNPQALAGGDVVTFDSLNHFMVESVSRYVSKTFNTEQIPEGRATRGDMALSDSTVTATPGLQPRMGLLTEPVPGSTKTSSTDGAEMVLIPEGEFAMGSDDIEGNPAFKLAAPKEKDALRIWLANESPRHKIYLNAYWIDKLPVTVAQYRKFCDVTRRAMPRAPEWGWKDDCPIVDVSWDDANAYAQWVGKRLPTEAEWEKAARGTDERLYPWGNEWDGNRLQCSLDHMADAGGTAPVGNHPTGASPYGVLDMAGNVCEWCADWYSSEYYENSPPRNPGGPEDGLQRVLRGGSWSDVRTYYFQTFFRQFFTPDNSSFSIGFRCVESQ